MVAEFFNYHFVWDELTIHVRQITIQTWYCRICRDGRQILVR